MHEQNKLIHHAHEPNAKKVHHHHELLSHQKTFQKIQKKRWKNGTSQTKQLVVKNGRILRK